MPFKSLDSQLPLPQGSSMIAELVQKRAPPLACGVHGRTWHVIELHDAGNGSLGRISLKLQQQAMRGDPLVSECNLGIGWTPAPRCPFVIALVVQPAAEMNNVDHHPFAVGRRVRQIPLDDLAIDTIRSRIL